MAGSFHLGPVGGTTETELRSHLRFLPALLQLVANSVDNGQDLLLRSINELS